MEQGEQQELEQVGGDRQGHRGLGQDAAGQGGAAAQLHPLPVKVLPAQRPGQLGPPHHGRGGQEPRGGLQGAHRPDHRQGEDPLRPVAAPQDPGPPVREAGGVALEDLLAPLEPLGRQGEAGGAGGEAGAKQEQQGEGPGQLLPGRPLQPAQDLQNPPGRPHRQQAQHHGHREAGPVRPAEEGGVDQQDQPRQQQGKGQGQQPVLVPPPPSLPGKQQNQGQGGQEQHQPPGGQIAPHPGQGQLPQSLPQGPDG